MIIVNSRNFHSTGFVRLDEVLNNCHLKRKPFYEHELSMSSLQTPETMADSRRTRELQLRQLRVTRKSYIDNPLLECVQNVIP